MDVLLSAIEEFKTDKKLVDCIRNIFVLSAKIDFDDMNRSEFVKLRKQFTAQYDKILDTFFSDSIEYVSKQLNVNKSEIQKQYKDIVKSRKYVAFNLELNKLIAEGLIDKKVIDGLLTNFKKSFNKLNMDLIVDDKILKDEGFFEDYPHLKP